MGFINLLKNGYRGKLGETVGQKWKDQLTVRTYQARNNSKSEAQLDQRAHYKDLIGQASSLWPSSLNIKAPKGKSMSDFNYYTSILEKIFTANVPTGQFYIAGQYNSQNIISPYVFVRDGSCWLYVNLPEGNPQADFKTLIPVIFYASTGRVAGDLSLDTIFTGNILEKKIKPGLVNGAFPRGYFVETVQRQSYRSIILAGIGKKKKGVIKWSGFTPLTPMLTLSDQIIEDI